MNKKDEPQQKTAQKPEQTQSLVRPGLKYSRQTGKKNTAKQNSVPPWMVTFADMMTLLMTFFVMLLSFSKIDAEQYRSISTSIIQSFNPEFSISQYEQGGSIGIEAPNQSPIALPAGPGEIYALHKEPERHQIDDLYKHAEQLLQSLSHNEDIKIEKMSGYLKITLKDNILFPSGSKTLHQDALEYISQIADLAGEHLDKLIIVGHTDSTPIIGNKFRSNWDLSVLRATSIAHQLINTNTIPAEKIVIQGHADTQPIADNSTVSGRAQNRRVEFLLHPHTNMTLPP